MPASRNRFGVACVLACLSGSVTILTLLWHDWVELAFGVEPDGGDGAFEWMLVVVLLVVTGMFSGLARFEWQRAHSRPQLLNPPI